MYNPEKNTTRTIQIEKRKLGDVNRNMQNGKTQFGKHTSEQHKSDNANQQIRKQDKYNKH